MEIQIHLGNNTVSTSARNVRFAHHKASLFLACLIEERTQVKGLTLQDFVVRWRATEPGSHPDRTAIRRLVQSLENGLRAVGIPSPDRLSFAPRQKTVGPWKFAILPDENWSVKGRDATPTLENLPSLLQLHDPLMLCKLMSSFVVADDLLRLGKFDDGAEYLQSHEDKHGLSPEGRCLWLLRLINIQRRLGKSLLAQHTLERTQILANSIPGALGLDIQATCEMLTARIAFDVAPNEESHRIDFHRLLAHVGNGHSSILHWQWANLHALAVRRKILNCMQLRDWQSIEEYVALSHRLFGATMYWLIQAQDSYHQQAVSNNYAYFLHWLYKHKFHKDIQHSLEWFKLAHTYVERFDFPEDSAWDFIMVGDLYLRYPEVKSRVDQDCMTWPGQRNPTELSFYEHSYEMAKNRGDPRQQIFALDQLVGFFNMTQQFKQAAPFRKKRSALMAQHQQLATDMAHDGFIPFA